MKPFPAFFCAVATLTFLSLFVLPQVARADSEQWSLDESDSLPSPEEIAASPAVKTIYTARLKWRDAVLGRLKDRIVEPHGCDTGDPCEGPDITLSFTVDAEGRIVDQGLTRSSRSPARDTAALATLNRVSPLPAPPLFENEDEVTLDVTIKRVKAPDAPPSLP